MASEEGREETCGLICQKGWNISGARAMVLLEQNDFYRLQHIMHAVNLTGINQGVYTESEWGSRHAVRLSEKPLEV